MSCNKVSHFRQRAYTCTKRETVAGRFEIPRIAKLAQAQSPPTQPLYSLHMTSSLERYFGPRPTAPRIAPAPDDDAADDRAAAPRNQMTAAQKVTTLLHSKVTQCVTQCVTRVV